MTEFTIKNKVLFIDGEPMAELTCIKPDGEELILWYLNGYERMLGTTQEAQALAQRAIDEHRKLLELIA